MAAAIQLKSIENANNLKYSGGLSEALQNNKDKGLDWFKNKLFKLDKASAITMCDPGICYVVAFNGLSGLGITSESGDFNGRQLQGQFVRVIGTDRFGNIVVTRLTTNDKPSQKSRPNTQEKPAQQPSLASPITSNYAEIVSSIDDLIIERVVENWARPPSARNGMVVVVQVEMAQDGTMRSVNVAKSSGDVPYDNSVVAAVKSIGRLSEMQELKPSDFQPYRSFKLTFSPEDLAL
ncbi:TonB C-terminal domain-containing protein [Pseudomonas sp. ANT_J28]|nr:TonB C-terminal domain-containing protein [Pseudomonas sp. ANT_J28]